MIEESKSSKEQHHDFLNCLLEELKNPDTFFKEDDVITFVFLVLFASHETISLILAFAIRALVENPSVLAELKFINETLRHSHVAPVMFGKATTDVQIKGKYRARVISSRVHDSC